MPALPLLQRRATMNQTYTAVYQKQGSWWIGMVEELPGAVSQERTLAKARESLRQAARDVIEVNRTLSRQGLPPSAVRETLEVAV
jgi:predicted RNase H-like HicB family nuclease